MGSFTIPVQIISVVFNEKGRKSQSLWGRPRYAPNTLTMSCKMPRTLSSPIFFPTGILLVLAISGTTQGESIRPDDDHIEYRGVVYPKVTPKSAELLRFSSTLLDRAKPNTHGFNPDKAKSTTGVSMVFATDSPGVTLNFLNGKRAEFAVYQDGEYDATQRLDSNGKLTVKSNRAGKVVQYRIAFPTFQNPIFTGMEIDEAHELAAPSPPRERVMVVLGDSITHGRGQTVSHQTWGWIAAETMQMEFYNIAVGGSNANRWQPESIAALPNVDLVAILWGYNDWVNRGKSVEQFEDDMRDAVNVIRNKHPNAEIAILRMLQTKTKSSKRTGNQYTADDFRNATDAFVAAQRTQGDRHLHIVASGDMTNTNTDLHDQVHLSISGASKLGKALATELEQLIE